ncbi:MAG: perosamine synthetase [Candidatus Melainabacteria bacterium HGW-Melainabacteria-1]|nr:MAG: perosamine synthetase [Candidatus Melainabacteria bacterium HGW-Melainabacteria-1]
MTEPLSTEPLRRIQISQPDTGEAEWQALREPVMSGWLTQGPKVAAFEQAFAHQFALGHALASSNCTTALHLILTALGIGPGDEVIVPAFTWVASANVVLYCGATPVFADIDPQSYNLDPVDLARRITPRTKAIMPVHLFGLCADIDAIAAVAGELPLIEDAACAVGARYKGLYAGRLGRAAAFSFHPRKTLTTGEGGMISTLDAALAETMSQLRNHGASVSEEQRHHGPQPYLLPEFNLLGFNYRMTDLQGAVGLVQLEKLDRLQTERRQWADYYLQELADLPWLQLPSVPSDRVHGWQAFVCRVDAERLGRSRNQLMQELQAAGISTRPGTHAVHMLGYYRERFGLQPEDFPVARDCDRDTMALPLHNRMSEADYAHVVKVLKQS